jgi:hypothetical protein
MIHWLLRNVLFNHQLFAYFLLLCGWVLVLLPCCQRVCRGFFQFSCLLRLALCPNIWSILEKDPWAAEKNVYCAMQDRILCRYLSAPLDQWCHPVLEFLCWFFCLDYLAIGDRGILKSPTTTVLGSICDFKSCSVCLMKLDSLTLGAYELIIVIFSWNIAPFISINCLFSLLI